MGAVTSVGSFESIFDSVVSNVGRVIRGKDDEVRLALVCLAAEGHLLIEDVPGVGKTTLAKALAGSFRLEWQRIQFTPDLLPSDVTGVNVYERSTGSFVFRPGGVFTNVLLGDEINRASPRTQAALLEAMQERQVTIDSTTYPLPYPFLVIATQNPAEHEGTYPLPESQLDRFLLRIAVGYPSRKHELEILDLHADGPAVEDLEPVADSSAVAEMTAIARSVHVAPGLKAYIVDLADVSRRHAQLELGMSPRAALFLLRASRALAAAEARNFVIPDDVKRLCKPVLGHRLILTPEARLAGTQLDEVIEDIMRTVSVPLGRMSPE